jgi:1-acyl-sn-glycerol-3-phosphate acyltransferase
MTEFAGVRRHWEIVLRGTITLLWVVLTTILYGPFCIAVCWFSQKAGYAIAKLWCRQILAVGGVTVRVNGLGNIAPQTKYSLLGNHQSNLDIQSLICVTPLYLYFIAKKELFNIPMLGWGIRALGHFPIDRSNARQTLKTFSLAAQRLRGTGHMSAVLFPEGTRSVDGKLGKFKQGSFTLVLEAGLPILPVAIQGTCEVLPKKSALVRPGTITITFLKPIDISNWPSHDKAGLLQHVRESIRRFLENPVSDRAAYHGAQDRVWSGEKS